jgi:hypothetical protein
LVTRRACIYRKQNGEACGSPPQLDSDYCWMHDPANAEAVADARRAGGLRRRREGTLATAYDLVGLTNVPDIRRLIEIAALDTLSLDNGVARNRTLLAAATAALQALEKGDLAGRVESLEAILKREGEVPAVFQEPDQPRQHGQGEVTDE